MSRSLMGLQPSRLARFELAGRLLNYAAAGKHCHERDGERVLARVHSAGPNFRY